jgi:hypothetical protein
LIRKHQRAARGAKARLSERLGRRAFGAVNGEERSGGDFGELRAGGDW